MKSLIPLLCVLMLAGCATKRIEAPQSAAVHEAAGAARVGVVESQKTVKRLDVSLTRAKQEAKRVAPQSRELRESLEIATTEKAILERQLEGALESVDGLRNGFADYQTAVADVVKQANAAVERDKRKSSALIRLKLLNTGIASVIAMAVAWRVCGFQGYGIPILLSGATTFGGGWLLLRAWLGA